MKPEQHEKTLYRVSMFSFEKDTKKKILSGSCYSFLFILSGSCRFSQEEVLYRCGMEDMILMKPGESLVLEKAIRECPLQIICVQYSPELLEELSDENTDLQASLGIVPFTSTRVCADTEIITILKNLANRLYKTEKEEVFGGALFRRGILSMIIVLILRACIHAEFRQRPCGRKQFMLDNVFAYIHEHLTEEITLEQLEDVFYVSKSHICREFKRETGQTVHSYIIKRKLELCEKYIMQGLPVTEVYKRGGFGGYNHFFRAFKKEYGMTPGAYYREHI